MSRPSGASRSGRRDRRPAPRRPVLDGARLTAYDVLDAVTSRAAYANLLLPQLLGERDLEQRDAAFATQLTYGTLRARGTLDAVLTGLVDRPLADLDPRVLDLLRLGTYQLLDLRVPAHAAVATTVDLTRAIVGAGASGLVNAVLRRVAAGGDRARWLETLDGEGDDRLALATDHPRWIVQAWREALGDETPDGEAELEAALQADDAAPEVHLVARRVPRAELVEQSGGRPGPWSPYAVRLGGGDPGLVPAVRSGAAAVQDEGSQLAALLLARAPLDGPDAAWLDMCAGPGGKSGLLAAVRPPGVRLTAADRAPHRAELVRRSLRGEEDVEVLVADGRQPPWAPGSFDRVLLDAPCTGLGALRRRPEVRWRRTGDDVPPLAELQAALLERALASVRPGGLVAYVTCSPHTAETVAVVDAAAARDDVEVLPVAPLFPEVPDLSRGRYGQLWPHRHGTDAMFLALLRRTR
ncbi:RsmB/NOP family class I SAM-dependent RNA methyltransferase [Geodermatophilus ruber]|uniref:16S rRNA (Cytosine967-C5)-methyltransferase n=1 Tax=Geodermatophilus ruber TaxID=504800 RepID=A0A1I4FGE8_9ACTN|nr:transcription antitermination factor NusB [Geodermatophilus ruber]SFL15886.1 16S rRNA (cytosine967-C5)-methyltransferase [Geodermatophilus ruber]